MSVEDELAAMNARSAPDVRYPKTVEQAIIDLSDAIARPGIAITPTNRLMLDICLRLKRPTWVESHRASRKRKRTR